MSPVSPPGPVLDPGRPDPVARDTYRYLRVAPLVVALFLGTSVTLQRGVDGGCSLGSISAYYFTPVHSVFVASLCVIGMCLIANQGNSAFEDVVLNFSGFLAFLVAMVPMVGADLRPCSGTLVQYDTASAITNNVTAVFIAALAAEVLRWVVIGRARNQDYRHPVVVITAALGYAVVARIVWQFFRDQTWFVANAHNWAAVTMFVGIILVILTNAIGAYLNRDRTWALGYVLTAALMIVLLVAVVLITAGSSVNDTRVFWIEVVLIASFGLFWGLQTFELWDYRDRAQKTEVRAEQTGLPTPQEGVLKEVSGA
ncbi:MAG: hypothetical protein IPM08_05950 [Actinomycetales bacterium]|nr:hypothetical protein [Actinomycetales bacterium]